MATHYSIQLAPGAVEDIKEAIEWYESRLTVGLASRFIKMLNESLVQLAVVPGKGSVRYKSI